MTNTPLKPGGPDSIKLSLPSSKKEGGRALKLALGSGGMAAAGYMLWRAWSNGVWRSGKGLAFAPWHHWQAEGIMGVVEAATLAASPHNTQPWNFRVFNNTIAIFPDYKRHLGSFDSFRREMHLALGCALENIVLAAEARGWEPQLELFPKKLTLPPPQHQSTEPAATVQLIPGGRRVRSELYDAIPHRHTNRGEYQPGREIPMRLLDELMALNENDTVVRLMLLTGQRMDPLAQLIVASTKAIVADAQMAADNAHWYRFQWNDVQESRDGLTLDATIASPALSTAAKIFPPSVEKANRTWITDTSKIHVGTAPLLGLIAVRDLYDRPMALIAGRLWQRLHLFLTARGLAAQPLNQPTERVDRERELNMPDHTAQALARITGDPDWRPTFIFRAGYPRRSAGPSPRRSLEAVVTWSER